MGTLHVVDYKRSLKNLGKAVWGWDKGQEYKEVKREKSYVNFSSFEVVPRPLPTKPEVIRAKDPFSWFSTESYVKLIAGSLPPRGICRLDHIFRASKVPGPGSPQVICCQGMRATIMSPLSWPLEPSEHCYHQESQLRSA